MIRGGGWIHSAGRPRGVEPGRGLAGEPVLLPGFSRGPRPVWGIGEAEPIARAGGAERAAVARQRATVVMALRWTFQFGIQDIHSTGRPCFHSASPRQLDAPRLEWSYEKERSVTTLTPEQRQEIQKAGEEPVRLADPETPTAYVILKADLGKAMQSDAQPVHASSPP